MPLLKVTTNTEADSFTATEVTGQLSRAVAELLGKPESYVMTIVEQNDNMSFAGTNEPLAFLELKSLGLPEDKTTEFSENLCLLIQDLFQIPPNRIYIEFSSPDRHLWGWDKRTF
ncbi:MAG: phenylpyruvate tautomerase MIF-related protein [Gammaproteobacteria bacterium]|jgi:phenylpyruvate tautomerase